MYLHGTVVDLGTIELLHGLGSGVDLVEGDLSDTTALSIGSVEQEHLTHWSYGLSKIFLHEERLRQWS